jgi:biopolymer transport protein ExbD
MKFPRNARMLKGHLDFAPFASVFFCLLIFVLLSSLVYTPGARIHLPPASPGQTGVNGPIVKVFLDSGGHAYFRGQMISDKELRFDLAQEVKRSSEPLTLVLGADTNVTVAQQNRLWSLAREAGITNLLQATEPGGADPPPARRIP